MQITQDPNIGLYYIHAYEPGKIKVNEEILTHSIIISSEQPINNWAPQQMSELTAEHLAAILALKPEVVLLGSGTHISFPPKELLLPFYAQQIGVEVMDTGAACRTYNVLISEGRRVVAGLLIR